MLRIAARGLPEHGPSIFVQIAQAAGKSGSADAARHYYRLAQHAGRSVGAKNLSEEEKQAYFGAVKLLAETATERGDLDHAIESWSLYTENERSGVETLRTLANLYEKKAAKENDQASVLGALRITEQALLYNGSDKDLLDKKDKYYYDIQPETLKPRRESVRNYFDIDYCLKKARTIIDSKNSDLELLDWALHLARVARTVQPDSVTAMVLEARALLRKGERDPALVVFEDLREQKPERFGSGEDEESWHVANRLLGDLYLNELERPDLAVYCYQDFLKSPKSGADTLYKLGQAWERCGEKKKAIRYYQQVTAYEGHPLSYDAQQAIYRLQSEGDSDRSWDSPA
jgi:hypothetical protein